jgi:hypothetical protein
MFEKTTLAHIQKETLDIWIQNYNLKFVHQKDLSIPYDKRIKK